MTNFCNHIGYCKYKNGIGGCSLSACVRKDNIYMSDKTSATMVKTYEELEQDNIELCNALRETENALRIAVSEICEGDVDNEVLTCCNCAVLGCCSTGDYSNCKEEHLFYYKTKGKEE